VLKKTVFKTTLTAPLIGVLALAFLFSAAMVMWLAQGRVSKSVFVRHYLKENPIELGDRTLRAVRQLDRIV
jgi:hypothetical protein